MIRFSPSALCVIGGTGFFKRKRCWKKTAKPLVYDVLQDMWGENDENPYSDHYAVWATVKFDVSKVNKTSFRGGFFRPGFPFCGGLTKKNLKNPLFCAKLKEKIYI